MKQLDASIKAKRVKPKVNACNCCLNKRSDCQGILEFHLINYGADFKIILCDACLKNLYDLGVAALKHKGKEFNTLIDGGYKDG